MNASPVKTTTDPESSTPSCYSSSLPQESEASTESPSHPSSTVVSESSPSRFPSSSPETAQAAYFVTLASGRHHISKDTEEPSRLFGSHGDRFDNSFSINASSSYTPVTSVLGFRDMRRHCPTMTPSGHPSQTSSNIFPSLEAELHDLSSRNHGGIKPDVSSMYHHHVMQRQHHPSEMHDFLSGDPMSASLPVALAAASDSGHHSVSSAGGQIHSASTLYGSHPHHSSINGMNSKLQSEEGSSVHTVSYEPLFVNGMTLSGLHHHHATASQISVASAAAHQMQSFHHQHHHPGHHHHNFSSSPPHLHNPPDPSSLIDADPRELEAFAEKFKQRRIKLGVTQADVGRALANLKLPGVGSLSQSTICRFESLTLSHNNMVALKPILQAWLEAAEAQARKNRIGSRGDPLDLINVLPSSDKKRKRTSIAAPEKRSLEAYFAVQPRPSGEKIAAIAEKLDLKKNVVRVWFCNQRQKQKRMKYSAANQPNMS